MRALAIAALSACGAAAAPPPPPAHHAAPAAAVAAPSWDPVVLTVERSAALAITARAVDITGDPTHELREAFSIQYDVVALQPPLPHRAELTSRVRCRVVGVNLYLPEYSIGYAIEDEHGHLVRGVASLIQVPAACEIGFAYRRTERTGEHATDNVHDQPVVATACLDAHGLRDGPCPPGTFPPPQLPPGFTIGLTTAKHRITDEMGGGIVFDGGVTFAEAPRPNRPYTLSYICADGARGDLDLHDLMDMEELDVLPAGSTLALRGFVSGYPAPTARSGHCEVTLTSRAPLVMHGRYCLANGDGAPGPCKKP
jgi:hypothetical protein